MLPAYPVGPAACDSASSEHASLQQFQADGVAVVCPFLIGDVDEGGEPVSVGGDEFRLLQVHSRVFSNSSSVASFSAAVRFIRR